MRKALTAILAAVPIGAATASAGAISVSAPDNFLLFAIGVSGLLIGRRLHRRRKSRDG